MHNSWCKYLWEQKMVFTDFSAKSSLIMTVVGRIDRRFGNLSGKYNRIQNPSLPDIEAKLTLNEFRRSKKCSNWRCLKCTKNSFILKSRIFLSVKNFLDVSLLLLISLPELCRAARCWSDWKWDIHDSRST